MRHLIVRRPVLLVAAFSAAVFTLAAAQNESSRIVREVGEGYLQAVTRENPMRQLKLGLPIDRLPDYSFAAAEGRAKEATALLARLDQVRAADLTYQEGLSADLLRRHLQTRVDDPQRFYFQSPVTPYSSPIGAMVQMFGAMPLTTAADSARYLARLDDMKTFTATLAATLQGQVARGIRIPKPELAIVDPFVGSFAVTGDASPFRPAASRLQALAPAGRDAFLKDVDSRIATVVAPSFHALAESLRGDYAARAPDSVGLSQYAGGLDAYRGLVKYHTTLDVTPEQVHAIGLENVTRINAEMAQIREQLKFTGTQAEFKASLRSNPRFFPKTPEEIGERLMTYVHRIEPQVDRYFGRKPIAPYGVKRLDPQLEP
jgi:uncharacterized protein (DUF885 family)